MSEKRKEYIDQLLGELKLLEERLLSVKENDALPFSFFSASFDRIEKISRSLHELELMQIGEMKEQMERLILFLSENSSRETEDILSKRKNAFEKQANEPVENNPVESSPPIENDSVERKEVIVEQETHIAEKVIFPEYRNPRITEPTPSFRVVTEQAIPERNRDENSVKPRSLNDIIQATPALVDLKRGISLNDRFLFQRELFNNNREEMNRVIDKLNTFGNFEEVENYLRSKHDWNFEDQTVKDFLFVIKKGFH